MVTLAESELAQFIMVEYEKVAVRCGLEVTALMGPGDACVQLSMGVEGRGTHALRGVPDEWQLFAVR